MAATAVTRFATQTVQLGGTAVLARLLTPEDYGVVALVTVLAGFANIFSELGIGGAIVQREHLSQSDLATAFWINVGSGLALTLLFVGVAMPIADLYDEPQLINLIAMTGLSFSLSVNVVQIALLERALRFSTVGLIEFMSMAIGLVVGTSLASVGVGALSLSIMFVSAVIARTSFCWLLVGSIPAGRVSTASARQLWKFSRGLIGFNLVAYFSSNVDNIAISRGAGIIELGIYSRAYNLMLLPIYQVQQVLTRVLFPALSSLQNDEKRLRAALERMLPITVAIGAPISLGVAASAPAIVEVVYGPQWRDVAPLLSILAVGGPAWMLSSALSAGLQAMGKTGVQFRRGLISAAGAVIAVSIGIHWGITGVAIALAIRPYVFLPLNYLPCARLLALNTLRVVGKATSVMCAAVGMGAVVFLLRGVGPTIATLGLQVVVGVTLYPLLLRFLAPATFRDVRTAIRR